ncbi:MAG: hypothetical protein ABUL46_03530, partial [Chitinophaga rupis]
DMSGAVRMEVITTYSGSFADNIRDEINNNSISDMQQNYLDFYNNYCEGMKVADSLRIEDNDSAGEVTTYEYYTIDNIWEQEKGTKKASFEALLIHSVLEKPRERTRTMPLELAYPARYREEIEIRVPEDWNFKKTPKEIRCPSFVYTSTIDATDRVVNIVYDYETLKDNVPVPEAATYLDDYERMKDDLGYVLTYNAGGSVPSVGNNSRGFGLGNLAKSLICLALLAGIVYFVRRK